MTARRLFRPACFLVLAVVLAEGAARAQPPHPTPPPSPGTHELWTGSLQADTVRQALRHFAGLEALPQPKQLPPDWMQKLPDWAKGLDPQYLARIADWVEKNQEKAKQLVDQAKSSKLIPPGTGNPTTPGAMIPPVPNPGKLPDVLKSFPGLPAPPPDTGPKPQPGKQPPVNPPAVEPKGPRSPEPARVPDPAPTPPRGDFPEGFPFLAGDSSRPDWVERLDVEESPHERSRRLFAALWEKNFGPLDETPTVKRALFDLVDSTSDIRDADGNNLWESLTKEAGDSSSLAEFLRSAAGEGWQPPKLDLPALGWGRGGPDFGRRLDSFGGGWWSPSRWSRSGSGGSGEFGIPGLGGVWGPAAAAGLVMLLALVLWRPWSRRGADAAGPDVELAGRWPVDPRRIATRRDVVLAFEYLGVLLCGPAARTWTHTTVAQALAELAAAQGEAAGLLARLYELARYAPADEPLTRTEVAEAGEIVCRLAGVEGP